MKVTSKKKAVIKAKAPSKADAQRKIRESNAANPKTSHKDQASVDKAELITSDKSADILPVLTEDQKQTKAIEDDKRFRELESGARKNFVEMMFILREMKAYELWKYLQNKAGKKYGSFDTWLKEAAPLSRAGGYAALKAADKLLPIIPQKELEQMPRYSVELLTKLPKLHLENTTIREAAKTQSKKELVRTIQKEAPDAHVEGKKKIEVDTSTAPIIGDAFEAAIDLAGLSGENEALEYICTDWLDSLCSDERFKGMSNREAWNALKQSKEASTAADDFHVEHNEPAINDDEGQAGAA